jgi:hypothetical protein
MYVNGRYWVCGNCGWMEPFNGNNPPVELSYKESHGWFFVQPDGHLFTIGDRTLWKSREEAEAAIIKFNEEAVKVS